LLQDIFWLLGSSTELFLIILVSLSLFRYPIRTYIFRTALFAPILGILIYYMFYELQLRSFIFITNLLMITVFYILFLHFHTLKALLVSSIGLAISSIYEPLAIFSFIELNIIQSGQDDNLKWTLGASLFATALLLGATLFITQKYRLGFIFNNSDFTKTSHMKPYNYYVAFLILAIVSAVIIINGRIIDDPIYPLILIVAFLVISYILITYSYKKNKKLLEKRYKEFD
jgi:hypothetical protein